MAADPSDLTTVAAVQQWKQIAGTAGSASAAEAAELQALITSVSAWITNYCGRNFVGVVACNEIRNGTGKERIVLADRPLVAVTSITVNQCAIPPQVADGQPGYFIIPTPAADSLGPNIIALERYCFARGRYNVRLSYTAGWATIPLAVAQACIEIVTAAYKRGPRDPALTSQAVENQTTAFSQAAITPAAMAMLDPYRKVFQP